MHKAELGRIEVQALAERAEYQHDRRQSVLELEVLAAVGRSRKDPPTKRSIRTACRNFLIAVGEEQEHATVGLCKS